jgi:farnesyl-diphosphate farnesyltransferase
MAAQSPELLTDILKRVSRSFYVTLRVLPEPLRQPMSLGYALARAADTLADTEIVPREDRIRSLDVLRQELLKDEPSPEPFRDLQRYLTGPQDDPAERVLLEHLPDAVTLYARTAPGDRARLRFVLSGLIQGMVDDLTRFPGHSAEQIRAFQNLEELDDYVYHAAGIVGEFWTEVCHDHRRSLQSWDMDEMKALGIRFGKGLQMVNVLRDTPRDIRRGRCYYPEPLLRMVDLEPRDLLEPGNLPRLRPVLIHLAQITLDHFESAREYVRRIPRSEIRLRLSCIWPLWIGLRTLALITRSPDFLSPHDRVRIPRPEVHRLIRVSVGVVAFHALVDGYTLSFRNEVEEAMRHG